MLKRVWKGVALVAVLFFCHAFYRLLFGNSGVAADVRGLGHVYENAGQPLAAFYTNTFLQQMPFNQPIIWKSYVFRSSYVSLTSRVDVASFKRKMTLEPYILLYLSNESSPGKPVVSFKTCHRSDGLVVVTLGQLNLSSGEFSMTSRELERMLDDEEWRHATNVPSNFELWETTP